MVRLVSATFVATTTRRCPSGAGLKTAACSAATASRTAAGPTRGPALASVSSFLLLVLAALFAVVVAVLFELLLAGRQRPLRRGPCLAPIQELFSVLPSPLGAPSFVSSSSSSSCSFLSLLCAPLFFWRRDCRRSFLAKV